MEDIKVADYISSKERWQQALSLLHAIMLDCQLEPAFKWGVPVYRHNGCNVASIAGFKEHCALSFFNGGSLANADDIFVAPGVDTQSMRMVRFKDVQEVKQIAKEIRAYVYEAIEVERMIAEGKQHKKKK